jgi:hypothetical protein
VLSFYESLIQACRSGSHALHGALEEVQPAFLNSVTLWWGCPWTLATHVAQLEGLAMTVVGLCYLGARTRRCCSRQRERAHRINSLRAWDSFRVRFRLRRLLRRQCDLAQLLFHSDSSGKERVAWAPGRLHNGLGYRRHSRPTAVSTD